MRNYEAYLQNEMASHIGKLLRDAFGKVPQSIYASLHHPFIVIYFRNFITPTEKILLEQGQDTTVHHTRDLVMKSLIPKIKAYLLRLTGKELLEFYYNWEIHNHSGVFIGRQPEVGPNLFANFRKSTKVKRNFIMKWKMSVNAFKKNLTNYILT